MKYPIAKPHILESDVQAVADTVRSGILSIGPKTTAFESQFKETLGVNFASAVSSGTAGLHVLLRAAGVEAGDEVITTPFSFIASANAIEYMNATPVFVDVDTHTYNINPDLIEAAITPKTTAILVVHIFGQCADMTRIMAIAKKHNLRVIEDACESILATHNGQFAGTFGDGGVFAFYPNKQMTTGEGGMIITNNETIYNLCDSYKNQGRDNQNMQWLDHKYLGYNYRMSEMQAALGVEQFKRIDFLLKEKKKIADAYTKRFSENARITPPFIAPENKESWFVYTIRVGSKEARDALMKYLEQDGISTKIYLPSIHLFEYYRDTYGYKPDDFPVSEHISDTILALPFYIGLTEKDIDYISKRVLTYLS